MMEISYKYKDIPAMTPPVVLDHMYELGTHWSGQGVGIELGSWLGATAVALLEGLVQAGYDRVFYAYDRWCANEGEVLKAKRQGLRLQAGEDILPRFLDNVSRVYNNISAHQGSIVDMLDDYPGDPIEFCIFDAPKRNKVFRYCIDKLISYWIPGVTILGLMDYYFYELRPDERHRFMAPIQFMKRYGSHFSVISEWREESTSVFFKYERRL